MNPNSRKPSSGQGRNGRFWAISVTVHAVVFALLVFFGPVRRIVLFEKDAPEQTEIITRGDELQGIVESIRDLTADKLRGRVELLAQGQDRMATNFAIVNAHFQPFEADQRATALSRLEQYLTQTLELQKGLVDTLTEAAKTDDAKQTIALARVSMPRILTAQDEIRRGIVLLDIEKAALTASQQEAQEKQIGANQFLRWLDDVVLQSARHQEEILSTEVRFAAMETSITTHHQEAARYKRERDDLDRRLQELDAETNRLKGQQRDAVEDARRIASQRVTLRRDLKRLQDQNAKRAEDKRDLEGEKRLAAQADELDTKHAGLRKRADDLLAEAARQKDEVRPGLSALFDAARKNFDRQEQLARQAQERLDDRRKRVAELKDNVAKNEAKRTEFLATARNVQTGAYWQQQEIVEQVRKQLAAAAPAQSAPQGGTQP